MCTYIYIHICIIHDVHAYTLYVYILDAYVCMYIYIYTYIYSQTICICVYLTTSFPAGFCAYASLRKLNFSCGDWPRSLSCH